MSIDTLTAARKAAALLVAMAVVAGPFASAVSIASATPVGIPTCTDTQTLNTDTNTCVDNPITPPVVVPDNFKISGVVFNDLNTDDHYNNGEPLLKNWEVDLHLGGENGPVVATDYTDAGGNYFFGNLTDGDYFVEEIVKNGWDQTTSDSHVTLSLDNSDVTLNFANVQDTDSDGNGGNGGDNGGTTPPPFVPQTGGLAVVNVVSGGTATPDQFSFSFDGIASTTFNASGENDFFAMATGTYNVAETATSTYTTTYSNCAGIVVAANATSTCTITNTFIAPVVVTLPTDTNTGGGSDAAPAVTSGGNGGGGGGGIISGPLSIGFVNTNTGGGLVLGTSTEATDGTSCGQLISTYMRAGKNNDKGEVTRLQTFLNSQMGMNIPVTGYFGSQTTAGVNAFQTKYQSDVLSPWAPFGLDGHTPTGYVYKTTQHKINTLACETLNLPNPQLP